MNDERAAETRGWFARGAAGADSAPGGVTGDTVGLSTDWRCGVSAAHCADSGIRPCPCRGKNRFLERKSMPLVYRSFSAVVRWQRAQKYESPPA